MIPKEFLFHPITCVILSLVWSFLSIKIAIKNEENEKPRSFPWLIIPVAGIMGLISGVGLPAPLNFTLAIALAGFIPAAWSDWHTRYLWDEILIPTTIFCGISMILGGKGLEAIWGGAILGLLAWGLWALFGLMGKESGLGDVKLIISIGIILGPLGGISAYFLSSFIGIAIWLYFRQRSSDPEFPFGPALVSAMTIAAFLTPRLDETYGMLLPGLFAVK